MKRLLPGIKEAGLFAVASGLCAAIVAFCHAWDIATALLSMPLFIICCILGLRKNGHLNPTRPVPIEIQSNRR